jgi:DNA-binding MurR/RpiR family transcriptional regulator
VSGSSVHPATTRAPRDFEGLRADLVARADQLSPRLNQVARFFLNHPEEVAIHRLARLAEQAQVPPATITRFAKELGFAGFAELQAVFRERLLGPRLPYPARLDEIGMARSAEGEVDDTLDVPGRVFGDFVQAAVHSLLRIEEALDRGTLQAFVNVMAAAGAVHVAAARGAFGFGAYTVFGLASLGKRAHLIDNLGAMRAAQVAAMAPGDVLVAMTFDDYTPETVEVAEAAARAGHNVLAITDNALSPVAPLATHVLFVNEARLGHFRSQVPAMVVVQSLIMSLGRKLGSAPRDKVNQNLQNPRNENSIASNRQAQKRGPGQRS